MRLKTPGTVRTRQNIRLVLDLGQIGTTVTGAVLLGMAMAN